MHTMRARIVVAAAIGLALVGLLAASIFVAPGPFYFVDAVNHFYLVQHYHQHGSMLRYTVNSPVTGSFYPTYAMYGGTLYVFTALLGTIFGSDWFAYGLSYLAGFAVAFLGVAWLARMLGLRAELAALVGLVYVTRRTTCPIPTGAVRGPSSSQHRPFHSCSPRFARAHVAMAVAIVDGHSHRLDRGVEWQPPHLRRLRHDLRADRRRGPGSGGYEPARLAEPQERAARLAGIATGFAINAWFLLPQAIYAHSTLVSSQVLTIYNAQLTHLDVMLAPFPRVSSISTVPHLYTNVPTLPLLWALCVLFVSPARRSTGRLIWLTTAVLVGYLGLMASHRGWAVVPRFLYVIQFPYRLLTYTTLIVCGSWFSRSEQSG